MKDLKFTVSNELYQGFSEISQLLNTYKFFIENMIGKQKDEPIEDFIKSQMSLAESVLISHMRRTGENAIKMATDWRNKNKETEEKFER